MILLLLLNRIFENQITNHYHCKYQKKLGMNSEMSRQFKTGLKSHYLHLADHFLGRIVKNVTLTE
jgi:hypothetical protein